METTPACFAGTPLERGGVGPLRRGALVRSTIVQIAILQQALCPYLASGLRQNIPGKIESVIIYKDFMEMLCNNLVDRPGKIVLI